MPTGWGAECETGEKVSKDGGSTVFAMMPKAIIPHKGGQSFTPMRPDIIPRDVWLLSCIVYQDTVGGPLHHTKTILHAYYAIPPDKMQFYLWDSDAD
jgi:hypothetical protein